VRVLMQQVEDGPIRRLQLMGARDLDQLAGFREALVVRLLEPGQMVSHKGYFSPHRSRFAVQLIVGGAIMPLIPCIGSRLAGAHAEAVDRPGDRRLFGHLPS
jgi:hypothetical protein